MQGCLLPVGVGRGNNDVEVFALFKDHDHISPYPSMGWLQSGPKFNSPLDSVLSVGGVYYLVPLDAVALPLVDVPFHGSIVARNIGWLKRALSRVLGQVRGS